jgi:hypothetical protein
MLMGAVARLVTVPEAEDHHKLRSSVESMPVTFSTRPPVGQTRAVVGGAVGGTVTGGSVTGGAVTGGSVTSGTVTCAVVAGATTRLRRAVVVVTELDVGTVVVVVGTAAATVLTGFGDAPLPAAKAAAPNAAIATTETAVMVTDLLRTPGSSARRVFGLTGYQVPMATPRQT